MIERAKTPLGILGWVLIVVPVLSTVFGVLYTALSADPDGGALAERLQYYYGSYLDLLCVIVGGVLLVLGGQRFAGALGAMIAVGVLVLTALVVLIILIIDADRLPRYAHPLTGYVGGALFVIAGVASAIALELLARGGRPPRPGPVVQQGFYGGPPGIPAPQQGFPPGQPGTAAPQGFPPQTPPQPSPQPPPQGPPQTPPQPPPPYGTPQYGTPPHGWPATPHHPDFPPGDPPR